MTKSLLTKSFFAAASLACAAILSVAVLPASALADGQSPASNPANAAATAAPLTTVEVTSGSNQAAAGAVSPMTTYSKSVWVKESLKDALGITLCTFKETVNYSYTRTVISSASASVTADVTSTGSALQWDYDGIIGSDGNYFSWGGHWNGGHYSYRQGKFRCVVGGVQIDSWYPWIRINVYGNGSWNYTDG